MKERQGALPLDPTKGRRAKHAAREAFGTHYFGSGGYQPSEKLG